MGWILLFGGLYIGGMAAALAAAFKMTKFGFVMKLAKEKANHKKRGKNPEVTKQRLPFKGDA